MLLISHLYFIGTAVLLVMSLFTVAFSFKRNTIQFQKGRVRRFYSKLSSQPVALTNSKSVSKSKKKDDKNKPVSFFQKPLTKLKGVGSNLSEKLNNLKLKTVADLLFHLPTSYLNRTRIIDNILNNTDENDGGPISPSQFVTIELIAESIKVGDSKPYCVYCRDKQKNPVMIYYFYGTANMVTKEWSEITKKKYRVVVSGKYSTYSSGNYLKHCITNPDIIMSSGCTLKSYNSTPRSHNEVDTYMYETLLSQSHGIYPLTDGITSKKLSSFVYAALDLLHGEITSITPTDILVTASTMTPPLSVLQFEWLSAEFLSATQFPSFFNALKQVHYYYPNRSSGTTGETSFSTDKSMISSPQLNNYKLSRMRLAFEELVIKQLVQMERDHRQRLVYQRQNLLQKQQVQQGQEQLTMSNNDDMVIDDTLSNCKVADLINYSIDSNNANGGINCDTYYPLLKSKLSFQLTSCQLAAIDAIDSNLRSKQRMVRLVQGDVGSGKTIVAVMAIIKVIESGKQVCLLAPTEILARQHYATIQHYLDTLSQELNKTSSSYSDDSSVSSSIPPPVAVQLKAGFISSSVKVSLRKTVLSELRSNTIQVLIGTHALLNKNIVQCFYDLGLVVIDEEQRFGVMQRQVISELTNVLYTTATPIPRSLALTQYSPPSSLGVMPMSGIPLTTTAHEHQHRSVNKGDNDKMNEPEEEQDDFSVSNLITTLPIKRSVKTLFTGFDDLPQILKLLSDHIPHGTKVFWVTPSLNPKDDESKIATTSSSSANSRFKGSSAKERYDQLNELFPGKVGLLHGRLSGMEKDDMIRRFSISGSNINSDDREVIGDDDVFASSLTQPLQHPPTDGINILVSTTVIEVGIDIPDASICIIERANYFGLSQLHQIRGRIGRGLSPETEKLKDCLCILIANTQSAETDDAETENTVVSMSTADKASIDWTQYYIDGHLGKSAFTPTTAALSERNKVVDPFHLNEALTIHSLMDHTNSKQNTITSKIKDSNIIKSIDNSYKNTLSLMAQNRLEFLTVTNDCFLIAEYDLRLRGAGDVFGHRQHGNKSLGYKAVEMPQDIPLLIEAKRIAKQIYRGQYIREGHGEGGQENQVIITRTHPYIQVLRDIFIDSSQEDDDDEEEEEEEDVVNYTGDKKRKSATTISNKKKNGYKDDDNYSNNNDDDEILLESEIQEIIRSSHSAATTTLDTTPVSPLVVLPPRTAAGVSPISGVEVAQDKVPIISSSSSRLSTSVIMDSNSNSYKVSSSINKKTSTSGAATTIAKSTATTATSVNIKTAGGTSATYKVNNFDNTAWLERHWSSLTAADAFTYPEKDPVVMAAEDTISNAVQSMQQLTLQQHQQHEQPPPQSPLHNHQHHSNGHHNEPVFIILDIETTGLSITDDEPIQLGAKVMGQPHSIYNSYILPARRRVSSKIESLTGISQSFLEQEGMSFFDAWSGFQSWVKEVVITCTNNSMITGDNISSSSSRSSVHDGVDGFTAVGKTRGVVFLAHNGRSFDFAILSNMYKKLLQQQQQTLIESAVSSGSSCSSQSSIYEVDWFQNHQSSSIQTATSSSVIVDYRFLDTMQLFRHNDIWDSYTSSSSGQSSVVTASVNHHDHNPSSHHHHTSHHPHHRNSHHNHYHRLPPPIRHNMSTLYRHIIKKELVDAHNAMADVEAVEEMLLAENIQPYWKQVARNKSLLFY